MRHRIVSQDEWFAARTAFRRSLLRLGGVMTTARGSGTSGRSRGPWERSSSTTVGDRR